MSPVNMHLIWPDQAAPTARPETRAAMIPYRRPLAQGGPATICIRMGNGLRRRRPGTVTPMTTERVLSATARTTLQRLRERGRPDRADLDAVLAAGLICHLGVNIDGAPVVLPTGYGWIGDDLYLHGSSANRSLLAAAGQQVCVTITLLDGLVCARAVFHHSMNYRSAVIFGAARLVTEPDEKLAALEAVTNHLVPDRWEHARLPTRKELAATAVLALPLDEASVKVRAGQPKDDPEDYDSGIWAGVLPAALAFGAAEPDPALTGNIEIPDHIAALANRARGAAPAGPAG
jgi:nitroimidazol reductase NimA-like FMN-containing flavoprotein (pyridoxamine 5'-phosphate oxidase superfamily)